MAVKELMRVLRPGGRLFLTTPNYLSMIGLYRAYCRVRGKRSRRMRAAYLSAHHDPEDTKVGSSGGLKIIATHSCGQYLTLLAGRGSLSVGWNARVVNEMVSSSQSVVAEKPCSC